MNMKTNSNEKKGDNMKQFITDTHTNQAITAIQRIVKFPSYMKESAPGAPFGQDIVACLKNTLSLFEEEGFTTFIDPDGYYGYAEIGEGSELFGVLCHLDVVPPGDETLWDVPPFSATVTDTSLIGRGVQDDKGPTIATLYALKAVLDSGATLNKKVRFIFGTDEETLWRCMDHYHEKEDMIDLGFAPDANFPLIYAEKGLLQSYATGEGSSDFIFTGGNALNVVADSATYKGIKQEEIKAELDILGYVYTESDAGITVAGKSIHSKDAPKGINANTRLAEAVSQVIDHPAIHFLGNIVKDDARGTSVVGEVSDEASGHLTFNAATVEINEKESKIGLDVRLPVTANKEEIVSRLEKTLADDSLMYQEFDYLASLYVPIESELVQSLLGAYRDVTGDMTAPKASGGATFARTMKNCVAFGAMFSETVDTMHQPNETWLLNEMTRSMEIYAEALYRLCTDQ